MLANPHFLSILHFSDEQLYVCVCEETRTNCVRSFCQMLRIKDMFAKVDGLLLWNTQRNGGVQSRYNGAVTRSQLRGFVAVVTSQALLFTWLLHRCFIHSLGIVSLVLAPGFGLCFLCYRVACLCHSKKKKKKKRKKKLKTVCVKQWVSSFGAEFPGSLFG